MGTLTKSQQLDAQHTKMKALIKVGLRVKLAEWHVQNLIGNLGVHPGIATCHGTVIRKVDYPNGFLFEVEWDEHSSFAWTLPIMPTFRSIDTVEEG